MNDIKNLQGTTWAQRSAFLHSTFGVRGQAVKATGGAGPIRLDDDEQNGYLARPVTSSQVTLALWLLYQSKVPPAAQTFLASGEELMGSRGIRLYQEDGSKEELSFRVVTSSKQCLVKFRAPQGIWTHLIFSWKRSSALSDQITVYRNGKIVADLLANNCENRIFPDITMTDFTIGSATLPTATFDDVIVWLKTLSKSEVERLFEYYEGKRDLFYYFALH